MVAKAGMIMFSIFSAPDNGPDKEIFQRKTNYFLTHPFKHVFMVLKDGSFEYPQHMFLLRFKKNNFVSYNLIWRLTEQGFQSHQRHCVVSLSKTHYRRLSAG